MSDLVGLELYYRLVGDKLKSKNDAVMAVLHVFLLYNNYKFIGLGNVPEANDSKGTEILFTGWNETVNAYVLRYKRVIGKETRLLLVKAVITDNLLLINVLDNPGELTGSVEITADTYITNDYTHFESAFTSEASFRQLIDKFRKEIMDKISFLYDDRRKTTAHQRPDTSNPESINRNDPLRIPGSTGPVPLGGIRETDPFAIGFPSIGRKDLDPFARPGGMTGGMLLDPRELGAMGFHPPPGGAYSPYNPPSGIPPNSIPPGARFDPINPNIRGQRPNNRTRTNDPEPDHLRPPGYDDMFM